MISWKWIGFQWFLLIPIIKFLLTNLRFIRFISPMRLETCPVHAWPPFTRFWGSLLFDITIHQLILPCFFKQWTFHDQTVRIYFFLFFKNIKLLLYFATVASFFYGWKFERPSTLDLDMPAGLPSKTCFCEFLNLIKNLPAAKDKTPNENLLLTWPWVNVLIKNKIKLSSCNK